ncbi:hypothetical protein BX592_106286 [Paraburkholderia rhizosphaerae]|uniref:Uncharacterized protein n=1 Tax=Paraburkholderia rhizosphaerae TaxID=480658 RepID=A0A4R8LVX4_9BURK|nr:hypothetical protein BX592_106286 [Paraburkholderia rhizosphaerae]
MRRLNGQLRMAGRRRRRNNPGTGVSKLKRAQRVHLTERFEFRRLN